MAKYRCVTKCYWKNILWSPKPDGKLIYDGDETPPFSKRTGKSFFLRIDGGPVIAPPPVEKTMAPVIEPAKENRAEIAQEVKPEPEITPLIRMQMDQEKKEWQLKLLSKPELARILREKYNTEVDMEATTRNVMIDMVIANQAKKTTNQDIAARAGVK